MQIGSTSESTQKNKLFVVLNECLSKNIMNEFHGTLDLDPSIISVLQLCSAEPEPIHIFF